MTSKTEKPLVLGQDEEYPKRRGPLIVELSEESCKTSEGMKSILLNKEENSLQDDPKKSVPLIIEISQESHKTSESEKPLVSEQSEEVPQKRGPLIIELSEESSKTSTMEKSLLFDQEENSLLKDQQNGVPLIMEVTRELYKTSEGKKPLVLDEESSREGKKISGPLIIELSNELGNTPEGGTETKQPSVERDEESSQGFPEKERPLIMQESPNISEGGEPLEVITVLESSENTGLPEMVLPDEHFSRTQTRKPSAERNEESPQELEGSLIIGPSQGLSKASEPPLLSVLEKDEESSQDATQRDGPPIVEQSQEGDITASKTRSPDFLDQNQVNKLNIFA
jgi:hypothetical protein